MADLFFNNDAIIWVKNESDFAANQVPGETDAVKYLTSQYSISQDRQNVPDRKGTRSIYERVAGRTSAEWEISTLLRPGNALGGTPNGAPLFISAMGSGASASNTSYTLTLSKDHGDNGQTLQVVEKINDMVGRYIRGGFAKTMSIAGSTEDFITCTFAGGAKYLAHVKNNTSSSAQNSNSKSLNVAIGANFAPGAIIDIDKGSDPDVTNYVTKVSGNTLTLANNAQWPNGTAVRPWFPDMDSYAHSPALHGRDTSVTFDGTAFAVTSFSVELDNMIENYFASGDVSPTDVFPSTARTVNLSLTFAAQKGSIKTINQFVSGDDHKAVVITVGTTAKKRCKIEMPKVNFDPATFDLPEEGYGEVSLSGTAVASSNENELKIVFN